MLVQVSTFLKKKMVRLKDGIHLVPGANAEKIVETFEAAFGSGRVQGVPCDWSIQIEDGSQRFDPSGLQRASLIVGMCLCFGRDRPDVIFAIEELASKMSRATCTSLHDLPKLVGVPQRHW